MTKEQQMAEPSSTAPALDIKGLSKTFPGQRALDGVDLEIRPGELHALVGQNGSGKSTLIKTLAGYHQPDPGAEATVAGVPLTLGDHASAASAGLRFVHQDLGLVLTLDALDNLALGRGYERSRTGQISWRREAEAARELFDVLGFDLDLRAPVSKLTAAERTGLAIARALQGWESGARVLVLDEPTASLPADEVERLFAVVRMVCQRGVAVLYVSHHFNEIFALSDRVTVLRDGRRIATRDTADLDEAALVELTIGRPLESYDVAATAHEQDDSADAEVVLHLSGVRGRVVRDLDLDVRAGEVVGFAGVNGSGREEIASMLYGAADRVGEVSVAGDTVPPLRPELSRRAGMALVPAERLTTAALPDMSLRENLTVGWLDPCSGPLGIDPRREQADAEHWLQRMQVVPSNAEAVFVSLSGGNQQKVVLGRNLRLNPKILILDEPTQGVDIGAKAAIHAAIDEVAATGMAVVVASTESEELVRLSDRIIVMREGRPATTLKRGTVGADGLTELTLRAFDAPDKA